MRQKTPQEQKAYSERVRTAGGVEGTLPERGAVIDESGTAEIDRTTGVSSGGERPRIKVPGKKFSVWESVSRAAGAVTVVVILFKLGTKYTEISGGITANSTEIRRVESQSKEVDQEARKMGERIARIEGVVETLKGELVDAKDLKAELRRLRTELEETREGEREARKKVMSEIRSRVEKIETRLGK